MFLTMNLLMALSFGTSMADDSQRTRRTCPRPCLFLPPFLRFFVIFLMSACVPADVGWRKGEGGVSTGCFII